MAAQPIHCDGDGDLHLADVLISQLVNGDTAGWCHPHFLVMCQALADAVAETEAAEVAAEASARLEQAFPAPFPTSGESSGVGDPGPASPIKPAGGRKLTGTPNRAPEQDASSDGPILAGSDDPDGADPLG